MGQRQLLPLLPLTPGQTSRWRLVHHRLGAQPQGNPFTLDRSLIRSRKKTPFITELVRGPSCRKISGVMKNHPLQWGDQTIQMYCHYQNLRGSKTTMSLTFQGLPWSRIASILVNPSSSRRIQPGGGTSIWTVKDQLYTSTRIPGVSPKISDKTRLHREINIKVFKKRGFRMPSLIDLYTYIYICIYVYYMKIYGNTEYNTAYFLYMYIHIMYGN